MNIAGWKAWKAADYFRDYYGAEVQADERAAIRYQIEFLRKAEGRFAQAVEYGCGPTLMRAIAAAPYVESLDMADHLESNLTQVRRWTAHDDASDDWSRFTRYALACEGVPAPGDEEVRAREEMTRGRIGALLETDAFETHPLGPARAASYDLLLSGFCVDCISQSRELWRAALGNIVSLVKPGGAFVILALEGCAAYRAGDAWFPAANVRQADLRQALLECGSEPASLDVTRCLLPSHRAQGYEGILLASGYCRF